MSRGARSSGAERARQLAADDAWIVDFTNPVGIVTRALLDAGHRAVGLCNVAINFQRQFAEHLGVAPERVLVDQVGLNHLTWIRAVWLDGRDVLTDVLDSYGDTLAHEIGLPRRLLDQLGAIPSYYLRYFYAEREVVQEQRMTPPRAQTVAEIERSLLELYRDPMLVETPALLGDRGPCPGSRRRAPADVDAPGRADHLGVDQRVLRDTVCIRVRTVAACAIECLDGGDPVMSMTISLAERAPRLGGDPESHVLEPARSSSICRYPPVRCARRTPRMGTRGSGPQASPCRRSRPGSPLPPPVGGGIISRSCAGRRSWLAC